MSYRTDWTRLEPVQRSETMEDGLTAPVRDPLWMLTRQWQFGELQGEDGGSPVQADLNVSEDRLDRVDPRGGASAADSVSYNGEPLEAVVEGERVMTREGGPPLQQRVDAGQQFLRLLADTGYGEYEPTDFHDAYLLDPPGEALESSDRRYVDLIGDRVLDGTAIADSIQGAVGNIDAVVAGDAEDWRGVSSSALPTPENGSRTDSFDDAADAYYRYYVELYDEPTDERPSAWDPARLAYEFAVSTGEGETETVFEADSYRGGHLDWYSFEPTDESLDPSARSDASGDVTLADIDITDTPEDPLSLSDLDDAGVFDPTIHRSKTAMPTQVSFSGMPASRFWEFEDGEVNLTKLAGDGADLSRLPLTEFALLYGNEWFQIDLDTPVGTLTRITDLTVTDSFGITERASPAIEEDWQAFMHELPGHDEPGLFLPPTLGESHTGDPVEKVVFGRDEMANLAFAIERLFESPTGRAVDRTEFQPPRLVIDRVSTDDDPDEESVELANPGEDRLSVDGYTVFAQRDGATTKVADLNGQLGPGERIQVVTGTGGDIDAELGRSVWTDADAVHIETDTGTLTAKKLLSRPTDSAADYRLSTDVPEYWFPFTPQQGLNLRLERALLLDADSLGLDSDALPTPRGELLDPGEDLLGPGAAYQIYDEELPSGGREVTRQYQYARWTDGAGHLWSGRESRPGGTQLSAGLRFDILEE